MSDKSLIAIYVAENPEAAERLSSNTFSLDVIVSNFLGIYLHFSGKTREELVKWKKQAFRCNLRTGRCSDDEGR
ncbi:hypothetical protein F4054_17425 [Candidatus Poribacteria bacterium]|nr:hypothetical protein [Candidatus Poribacteria bacterium]MYG06749.1 hypothetical protein [Candidatus Poribacteria bacterium]MYK24026.1 hypothetical protein [Candidatus Poribacteria bacterium]